jgi:protein ImuA
MTYANHARLLLAPGFDRGKLPAHIAHALWCGNEVSTGASRTVPTGYATLDKALPGQGWPTASLCELLQPQAAVCEWRLLGPALPGLLADKAARIYLVAPPQIPHAMGLAQLGLPPEQLVWIDAKGAQERLWVTEQLLKSEPAGAVIAWLPQARQEQIRRLQVHAIHCDAPVFLVRPETAMGEASAAPLRVSLALGTSWDLDVCIRKRRGAVCTEVLHLQAIPGNLDSVIPPRMRELQAPGGLQKEVFHALGRSDSHTASGHHLTH